MSSALAPLAESANTTFKEKAKPSNNEVHNQQQSRGFYSPFLPTSAEDPPEKSNSSLIFTNSWADESLKGMNYEQKNQIKDYL